jgi:hypothetical protein
LITFFPIGFAHAEELTTKGRRDEAFLSGRQAEFLISSTT